MSLLKTYKPVLVFTAKFAGTYAVLVGLYSLYLGTWEGQTDPLTRFVGENVNRLFGLFHIDAATPPLETESGLKLIVNDKYVGRIVEGCTASSVIIMFVAFVLAFGKSLKKSLVFALVGSLLIFIVNIFRIAFLGYLLYAFPAWQDVAHRIVFPALIYGFVVMLWIVFIKKYNE